MPFTYQWEETSDAQPASTGWTSGQKLSRSLTAYILTATGTVYGSDVLAALALEGDPAPYKGAVHPAYPLAVCTDVRADVDQETPWVWKVTADYVEAPPQPGDDPSEYEAPNTSGVPDPEARAPRLDLDFRRGEEYRLKDLDGNALVNPAGDPYDSPPPFDVCTPVLTVVRNFAAWSVAAGQAYFGKWNTDAYQGQAVGYWKIVGVRSKPVTQKGWPVPFWEVTFTMEGKDLPDDHQLGDTGGWQHTGIANLGWNYLDGSGDKLPARAKFGEQLAAPIRLDVDGTILDLSSDPDAVKYRFFRYATGVSFALLSP